MIGLTIYGITIPSQFQSKGHETSETGLEKITTIPEPTSCFLSRYCRNYRMLKHAFRFFYIR
jgi:hypothetical protein